MSDPIRDCPHGHMKGKCDSCELVVAEARIKKLEKRVEELEYVLDVISEDSAEHWIRVKAFDALAGTSLLGGGE